MRENNRNACAATVVEKEIFVIGGHNNEDGYLSNIEAHNTTDDKWRTLPNMPTARCSCAAVSKNNKIYVVGGRDQSRLSCLEMVDLETENIIGNYLIVAGGWDGNRRHSSAELFSLTTHQWMDLPEMSFPHSFGAMVVVGTKAYIFGGEDQKSVEVLDLETHQWTTLSPMSMIRDGCAAVVIGNFILVIGGGTDVVEVFDVVSQSWSEIQKLPEARQFCAAGFVGNQVLVVGGKDLNNFCLESVVSLNVGDLMVPCLPKIPNVLEMEHEEGKTALNKWVTQMTTLRQEYLAKVETETAAVNKEYATKSRTLEEEYATKKKKLENEYAKKTKALKTEHAEKTKELETDKTTKQSALSKWYKETIEKQRTTSDEWVDQVDDKLKAVKDQMQFLQMRTGGVKRRSDGSDSEDRKRRAPDFESLIYCPITGNIMADPVVAADGHTYERSAIEGVFAETPDDDDDDDDVISPVVGEPLASRQLVPNAALQAMASQYM
eukprot:CAMPEP_0116859106 /NCGR_PEP_ID=MMETSP0418-20121206/21591_1 /TAXON_ID=1158023 /ORGANISM="Astrosyne radiata, Strain 13vi08-1A" /LENGTH=491 /DNA_ID=CAMNT_0004493197 /DNA_START=460 /DNA_END=1936 /DNA_ORIENTATION=+